MKDTKKYLAVLFIVVVAFSIVGNIFAQTSAESLSLPGYVMGEITSAQAANTYIIEASDAQIISLEVLTLTEGYSPSFSLLNSAGETLPIIADTMSGWGIDMKAALPEAGSYRIVIGSLDGSTGTNLLRVNTIGSYLNHEYSLEMNHAVEASITGSQQVHRYYFTGQSNHSMSLIISSTITSPSMRISLVNQSWQQEVGTMDAPVAASIFCIPASTDSYTVDLMSGEGMPEGNYSLMLTSNASASCDQLVANVSANSTSAADGQTAANGENGSSTDLALGTDNSSNGDNGEDGDDDGSDDGDDDGENPDNEGTNCHANPGYLVNVRSLPTVNSAIIATVDANSSVEVLSYILNTTWVQVRLLDGSTGYMSAGLLNIVSVCVNVNIPVVSLSELGLQDLVLSLDASAEANVNLGGVQTDVSADANVNLGENGVNANVDANANVGSGEVNVDTEANVGLGTDGDVNANVDVEANVGTGDTNTGVNLGVEANLGNPNSPEVDVEADVNLGPVQVQTDVEVNLPNLPLTGNR